MNTLTGSSTHKTPFEELPLSVPRATFSVTRSQLYTLHPRTRATTIPFTSELQLAFPLLLPLVS